MIDDVQLRKIVEAALLAADGPLTVDQLLKLFRPGEVDEESVRGQVREVLKVLEAEAADRGYELKRVASGYRYQVRQELSQWISRLWEEKPPRYSRALLETLALVAYKQPVTRGDIEQVRGVTVSQNIMRTLLERGWVRVVGQREVPGRPALYGTTRAFLDYFNLKSLDQLPPLAEIRELIEPVLVEDEEPPQPAPLPDIEPDIELEEALQAAAEEGDVLDAGLDAELEAELDGAGEPTPGAEPAAEGTQPAAATAEAAEVDVVADASVTPEPDESGAAEAPERPHTAEVVQLPTAQH